MSTLQEEKCNFRYTADEILEVKGCFYAQQPPVNLPDWFQAEIDGTRFRQNGGSPFATPRQGATYYQQAQPTPTARSYHMQFVARPSPLFRRSDYDLPLMNATNGNVGFRPLRPVSPSAGRPERHFHQNRILQWNIPPVEPNVAGHPRLSYVFNFPASRSPIANNPPLFY